MLPRVISQRCLGPSWRKAGGALCLALAAIIISGCQQQEAPPSGPQAEAAKETVERYYQLSAILDPELCSLLTTSGQRSYLRLAGGAQASSAGDRQQQCQQLVKDLRAAVKAKKITEQQLQEFNRRLQMTVSVEQLDERQAVVSARSAAVDRQEGGQQEPAARFILQRQGAEWRIASIGLQPVGDN